MKLHFPWSDVEKLIEEVNTAKTSHQLYGQDTGKGLWLVGDHGVYLMPNTIDGVHHSKLDKDDQRLTVYANECNPDTMKLEDWWENKCASFGGDDGVEILPLQEIESIVTKGVASGYEPESLVINFSDDQHIISVAFKKPPENGKRGKLAKILGWINNH